MITAVIGHRGTGKTELMHRLQYYWGYEQVTVVDLDQEIETKVGRPIPEIFMEHGEAYFREIEQQLFVEILQRPYQRLYLILGAGFDVTQIPEEITVLWVRRKTDLDGRIFLNRPRLNPELSPLEEFQKRAELREIHYRNRADEIYLMPEGLFENRHQAMLIEKQILRHEIEEVEGCLTILPEVLMRTQRWQSFKDRYRQRGIHFFELRTDLFNLDQISLIMAELSGEDFIFSFRGSNDRFISWDDETLQRILQQARWIDWAWELGPPDEVLRYVPAEKLILSLHDHMALEESLSYEDRVGHFKYAPVVKDFESLRLGHEWQQTRKSRRSFLPRSKQGRWDWYRLLQKGKQLINFWREGDGSSGDQPSLWQWLMMSSSSQKFAAVLGDPIHHSYTPLEHSDFFHKRNMPVLGVSVGRAEWDQAMPFLRSLGLSSAAVTSPHKEKAAVLCRHENLKAVNTLWWDSQKSQWLGISTDEAGFLSLIEGVGMIAPLQSEIVVWGGGGTLEMLLSALPHARFFSARTGEDRAFSSADPEYSPEVVIWAAPRSAETKFPRPTWKPQMIFDLNYKEDSMGREYAQRCGANYQSGVEMFKSQAQGQRKFWIHCEESQ